MSERPSTRRSLSYLPRSIHNPQYLGSKYRIVPTSQFVNEIFKVGTSTTSYTLLTHHSILSPSPHKKIKMALTVPPPMPPKPPWFCLLLGDLFSRKYICQVTLLMVWCGCDPDIRRPLLLTLLLWFLRCCFVVLADMSNISCSYTFQTHYHTRALKIVSSWKYRVEVIVQSFTARSKCCPVRT